MRPCLTFFCSFIYYVEFCIFFAEFIICQLLLSAQMGLNFVMSDAVFFSNSNFLAPKLLLLLLVNKYTGMNIYTYTSVVMFHMIIEFDPIHSWLQMKILFGYQRLHDFWTLKAEIEVVLKLFSSFYSGALLKKLPQFEEILSKCFYFGLFMQLKSTLLFIYLPRSKIFSSFPLFKNYYYSYKFYLKFDDVCNS